MTHYITGWTAALLVGLSKTGLPGASIPGIALLTSSFDQGAREGVFVLLPILLVADVYAVSTFRQYAQWDRIVRLLPAVAVGMVPGWLVLKYTEEAVLKPVIGWTILIIIIFELARRRYGLTERVPQSLWFAIVMGILAGFCTMVAHAAMPVMTIYLVSLGLDRKKFVGTAAWFFMILNLCKIPFYGPEMIGKPELLWYDLWVAPVALIGCMLGALALKKMSDSFFTVLALVFAAIPAIHMTGILDPLWKAIVG